VRRATDDVGTGLHRRAEQCSAGLALGTGQRDAGRSDDLQLGKPMRSQLLA
jgi:hypothetical protein